MKNINKQIEQKGKELERLKALKVKLDTKENTNIKWIKTPFGFDVSEVMYKSKSFNEIKELIPKETEVINCIQCLQLYQNIIKDEWIWCLDNKGRVARFGAGADGANLNCGGDASDSSEALGVRFVRKVSK
jgi:hypothetical protein